MDYTLLSNATWPHFGLLNRSLQILLVWAIWHSFHRFKISGSSDRRLSGLVALIVLAILVRTPYSAGNLEVSDAVQYVIGALNFARTGVFEITLDGIAMPPRYPPWFSTVILEPFYQIPNADIGIGIIPVTILSLLGVAAAYQIGFRSAGLAGGTLAAIGLTLIPEYRHMTRIIWSDAPTAAFSLILMMLFCRTMRERRITTADCLAAAILGGIAGLFRFTGVGLLVPFLIPIFRFRSGFSRLSGFLVLGSGWLIAAALTCVYNQTIFGDPFRSGYHTWVSVPYDIPSLLFNARYITESVVILFEYSSLPGLIFLHILIGVPVLRRILMRGTVKDVPRLERDLVMYTLAMTIALLPVFLPYFYFRERFLLPIIAPLVVLLAIRISHLAGSTCLTTARAVQALAAFAILVIVARPFMFEEPTRRQQVEQLLSVTPKDSVVISALDPLYLETMLRDLGNRQIIPLSRKVEFASKYFTPSYPGPLLPPPRDADEHLAPALAERGSILPIRHVALDEPGPIPSLLADGKQIYLETWNALPEDLDLVRRRFRFEQSGDYLYRITGLVQQ